MTQLPAIVLGAIGTDVLNLCAGRMSKSDFTHLTIIVGTWRAGKHVGAKHHEPAVAMLRQHRDFLSFGMQQLVEQL